MLFQSSNNHDYISEHKLKSAGVGIRFLIEALFVSHCQQDQKSQKAAISLNHEDEVALTDSMESSWGAVQTRLEPCGHGCSCQHGLRQI